MSDERLPAPATLHSAVNKLIRKRGLADRTAASALDEEWKQIVGPELGARSVARKIKDGIVEVAVTNGAALEQLRGFFHETALAQLRERLPESGIRGIRYVRSG